MLKNGTKFHGKLSKTNRHTRPSPNVCPWLYPSIPSNRRHDISKQKSEDFGRYSIGRQYCQIFPINCSRSPLDRMGNSASSVVNTGVDRLVTTTSDFRVGRSWGGRGARRKYYYILIISNNVQEYEIKTRYTVVTFQK